MIIKFELTFITLVSTTSHYELHFVSIVEFLPDEIYINVFVLVIKWLAWSTWEIFDCFVRLTSYYVLIATVCFGVCFLQQKDPELIVASSSSTKHSRLAIWLDWDKSIKLYQFPFAIETHPNQKISIFYVIVLEQSLNKSIVFCKASQRAQKVAISKLSLHNVVWIDSFFE